MKRLVSLVFALLVLHHAALAAEVGTLDSDGVTTSITVPDGQNQRVIQLLATTSADDLETATRYVIFKRFDYATAQKIENFLVEHPDKAGYARAALLIRLIKARQTGRRDVATSAAAALEQLAPAFRPAERLANQILTARGSQKEAIAIKMRALSAAQRSVVVQGLGIPAVDVTNTEAFRQKCVDSSTSPALALDALQTYWPYYNDIANTTTRSRWQYFKANMIGTLLDSTKWSDYHDQLANQYDAAVTAYMNLTKRQLWDSSLKSNLLIRQGDYATVIKLATAYVQWVCDTQAANPNSTMKKWLGQGYVNLLLNTATSYEATDERGKAKAIYVYLAGADWLNYPSARTKGNFQPRDPASYGKIARIKLVSFANDDTDTATLMALNSIIVD
ncbi:hypothetical protein LLG95_05315 [bacterium]|nr:hypothetical protein [bacterium]